MLDTQSHEAIAIVSIALILLTEYKWHFWTKQARVFTGGVSIGIILYGWWEFLINTKLNENITTLRVENLQGGPHEEIWIILWSFTTAVLLAPNIGYHNQLEMKYAIKGKSLWLDPMTALAATGFVLSTHELNWYLFFFISNANLMKYAPGALPYIAFLIVLLEAAYAFKPFTRNEALIIIASMMVFNAAWALSGFQITVGFDGLTQFYKDLAVNNLENESWIVPIFITTTILFLKSWWIRAS